ncbi:metal-dependent hydrolase [Roseomonas sp. BN140053]|uniref:metal-dependent hydrolase n=1 Tax=Roseomonas sp. BN140053 TaxID=3391898 RepID=UPI0039E74FD9
MLAGSHVALGAAAWVVAAPRLGLPAMNPASLALAVLGGLLPDIDHPKSWVGQKVRPVSDIIGKVFGHRGITHSLLAVAGCCLLLLREDLPRAWLAPVVVGYLSHLAADLLTPGGLRLAWPIKGTYALPLCRTGSPFEPLVVALIVAWAGCGAAGNGSLRADWNTLGLCRLWEGSASRCAAPVAVGRAADRPRPQLTNRMPPDAPRGARS